MEGISQLRGSCTDPECQRRTTAPCTQFYAAATAHNVCDYCHCHIGAHRGMGYMTQNGVFGGEAAQSVRATSSAPLLERKTMAVAARNAIFATKTASSLRPVSSPAVVPPVLEVKPPSPLKRKPSAAALAAKRIRTGNAIVSAPTPSSTPMVMPSPAPMVMPSPAPMVMPSPAPTTTAVAQSLTRVTRGQTRAKPVVLDFEVHEQQPAAVPVAAPEPIVDTPALRRANRTALRVSAGRWWPRDCVGTDLDMPLTYRWRKVPWAPEVSYKEKVKDMETYCFTCCKQLADDARNTCPVCMRWVLVECAHQCDPNDDDNWGKNHFSCCFCGDDSILKEWEAYKQDPESNGPSRPNFDA